MSEMERIDRAADYVRDVLGTAEIAIVLGSGLGDYAEVLTDAQVAPYHDIPGFPESSVYSIVRVESPSASTVSVRTKGSRKTA